MSLLDLRQWVKAGETQPARYLKSIYYGLRNFEVPSIKVIHGSLYKIHNMAVGALGWAMRVGYWTPLFKSRLTGSADKLFIYGGMPLVTGPLRISVGKSCRISGATTFSGRWNSNPGPCLTIGDNVGIGWQTTIAVGSTVSIGNNVRIAGRAFLAGYPGHPLNAYDRARGMPDLDEQVGDIVLEDDVWLGTGVTVSAKVRIGAQTIVASGSVVTADLPSGVLAAGVPAKVIRQLPSIADVSVMEEAV